MKSNALKRRFSSIPIATVNGANHPYWRDMAALWFYTTTDLSNMAGGGVDEDAFISLLNRRLDFVNLARELKQLLVDWRRLNGRSWGTLLFWVMVYRSDVLQPVLPAVEHYAFYRDWQSFQIVHHYLAFLYKAPSNNPDLEEQALTDYMAVERTLPDTFDETALCELREVLEQWCTGAEAFGLPNFGPGSTADAGPDLSEKQRRIWTDEMLRNFLPELSYMFTDTDVPYSWRVSRTVFVPKTALSLRTISMEPAYLSFWQTPVERMLKRILSTSCRHCCDLTKQSKSRQLAIKASADQEYATLDLSAASDSVSLALVTQVFPWSVCQRLLAIRSVWTVLPQRSDFIGPPKRIELKKYAPMGSRATFPLETLLFCAICEVAVRRTDKLVKVAAQGPKYWVYGDDIIIKVEYVTEVCSLLSLFGFRVNETKSFRDGMFYEACGVFAFKGRDITTPCIPRNFEGLPQENGKRKSKALRKAKLIAKPSLQPSQLEQGIELCNRFLLAGMETARAYVMSYLPVDCIPFCEFQFNFLNDEEEEDDPSKPKINWVRGGLWTFAKAANNHLEFRRLVPTAWIKPPLSAPDQGNGVLLLPDLSLRSPRSLRPIWSCYEYRVLRTHTEDYRNRYDEHTRYDWKLRHPNTQPGGVGEIPTPPVGFGPRRRLRKEFTQF